MPSNLWNNLKIKNKKFANIIITDSVLKKDELAINNIIHNFEIE